MWYTSWFGYIDERNMSIFNYVHCYAHRFNLASGDSLPLVLNWKNALRTIQSLYNFIGENAKRVASFKDIAIEGEFLSLSLKSLNEIRLVCRY